MGGAASLAAELIGDTEGMVRRHYARWVPERQARLTSILKRAFGSETEAGHHHTPVQKTGTDA